MAEGLCGDLVALSQDLLELGAKDLRHGCGCCEGGAQLIDSLFDRESCDRGRELRRADAVAAGSEAEVHRDADSASLAVRPTDLGILNAALVGDGVAVFPGHGVLLSSS